MVERVFRRVFIAAVLMLLYSSVFGIAPSVKDMVNMGQNLEYIANYIISHASEFEAYTVDIAKVFLGLSASGVVSGAATGAQALSVWAKVAAGTGYGLVVALSIYDIVKAWQLISALIELSDIKKGIAEIRYVQKYDRLGIQNMPSVGMYQEYYVRCFSRPSETFTIPNGVVYEFIFVDPQYYDGSDFYLIEYPGYFLARYYSNGGKNVSELLGFMNYHHPYGVPSDEFIDFVTTTGILDIAEQRALSYSYSSLPGYVVWDFMSPGLHKVDPFDEPPISDPLLTETQKMGVITTPDGRPLASALSPEQWASVSSLTDVAPYLNFTGMEYGAYRTVSSYEVAVPQQVVDTSKIVYSSGSGSSGVGEVDPETIQEIQEQLETLTQTVQEILADMQQVQTIPELQQEFSELQETQSEISALVQTLAQTLEQVQAQTQTNSQALEQVQTQTQTNSQALEQVQAQTQTNSQALEQVQAQTQTNSQALEQLQEQYQAAVELMTAAQTALQTVNNVQEQYQTLQQTQAQLTEAVGTLSQTVQQVQTQTQTNSETLQQLQEQCQAAVELMAAAQPTLESFVQEYPGLKEQVQKLGQDINEVKTQVQALSQSGSQTQEQYETIISKIDNLSSTMTELIENISVSVSVDLSPVVEAVNEVSVKVDALSEQVQSLQEYLEEGFFEKLAEKIKELLEELFVPDPEAIEAMMDFNLPEYGKQFGAEFSFSSESVSIPIQLYGASVDLSSHIRQYSSGLKHFMNLFVSAIAAVFVIRAFRVHLNID